MKISQKNPAGGNHRAGEKGTTSLLSHASAQPVKLRGAALLCGQCPEYRPKVGERGRQHCRYLGVSVRAGGECCVDPLTGDFLDWIAEEERSGLGVTP